MSANVFSNSQENPFSLMEADPFSDTQSLESPQIRILPQELRVELGSYIFNLISQPDQLADYGPSPNAWPSRLESLAFVTAHHDAGAGLRRYRFVDAPIHSALHIVDNAEQTASDYCNVHVHDDFTELNVILPSQAGLIYEVRDGNQTYSVGTPALLWFPPGVPHCAVAQEGSGLFFVARFPEES